MLGPNLRMMKKVLVTPPPPPPTLAQTHVSSEARSLCFGLNLSLQLYFEYASSKGSEETALMHSLTCTFAAH